jgi:hypothetical protein
MPPSRSVILVIVVSLCAPLRRDLQGQGLALVWRAFQTVLIALDRNEETRRQPPAHRLVDYPCPPLPTRGPTDRRHPFRGTGHTL